MSEQELYHRGLIKHVMQQNRAASRDDRRKMSTISKASIKSSKTLSMNESREELTAEQLSQIRDELDHYILPKSDQ